jgi:hypothetical protein
MEEVMDVDHKLTTMEKAAAVVRGVFHHVHPSRGQTERRATADATPERIRPNVAPFKWPQLSNSPEEAKKEIEAVAKKNRRFAEVDS